MRLRPVVIAGTITALVGAVLMVNTASSPVRNSPPLTVAEAPDSGSAFAAAASQRSPVAVASLRTPTREVFANPGGTLTAELTAVPVRVRQGDIWVGIDQSMVRRADNSIGPKAAIGELTLSGGGANTPLASLRRDGRTLAVDWPGVLPVPTLSGNAATYAEVLPGVDLVIVAERNGYQQHLVVKNAEAARNPALASIRLGIVAEGLRVSVDEKGALHAVDEAGADVFTAPPSTMWDSAEHTAPVGVSVVDGSLILTPDAKFLADPSLVYPVTIDPRWTTFERWGWATVLSGKPNDKYWWTSGSPPWAQVGQCYTASGECNGIGEAWAYFQFDTTFLNGKTVINASFDTTVVHSPRCSDEWNQLYRADAGIWDGMTWNSRVGGTLISNFMAPDNCTGWWPVGVDVRTWLTGLSHTGFFLKAFDPNNQFAWRKYDPGSTKVRVQYNQKPYPPTNLRTDPPLPAPCKWCGGKSYFGDDNIRLIATLSDPDEDLVRPQWRVSGNGALIAAWDGAQQGSGATHDANVGLWDHNGKEIGWWVHGSDDTVSGDATGGPRTFVVDRTGFTAAQSPDVSAVLYQPDGRWHGGVGVADTFTFKANKPNAANPVTDVDHYLWGWQNPPPETNKVDAESLNGPASVRLTPPGDGPRDLYVQSVDRAGHRSPVSTYHFYVRAGNGPLAQWSFDGNANDTAFLGDRHGTLNGGATFAPGAIGASVQLDGVDDHVSAPNAIRNDTAFSVSAWVYPKANNGARAVVSQDGALFPGFALWYRAASDGTDAKWAFGVPNSTTADRGVPIAASPAGMPQLNTWTHLAGVYDPVAKQVRLYVNGTLVHTVAHTAKPEVAAGLVRIGRTMWGGNAAVDHWRGGIDEVQIYDRVLSDTEIAAAVRSSGVQAAHWKFDEDKGTTAGNAVEGGPAGVLEHGASFTQDGAVNGGMELDGDDDVVSTAGPVVRTDQSFSVAAQVRLKKVDGGTYTALSQDGERICGFCLQYQGSRWVFVFPRTDADIPLDYDWVDTPAVPDTDDWTHLAGVYDAAAHKIRLYVNGVLAGEKTATVAWSARKPMRIGQALLRGEAHQHWPGTVDEVRVYSRAISQDEVQGIVSRDNVTAGTWKLDGNANDENGKLDSVPNGTTVDWSAGQTTNPDPADLAVRLNGTGSHLSIKNAIDTDKSFSVAAWARPDKVGGHAAVVSQDGNQFSGFMLKALPDGRWAFVAPPAEHAEPDQATSGPAAQPGVWTHLVGVYSKESKRIELYVNGVLAASAPHTAGFDATGLFQIGRSRWNNANTDYFPGAIDDVVVYSRTLFAGEIQAMAGRDLTLGHDWTMDEGSGNSVGDSVGVRRATLSGGPTFGPGRVGNAVRFDGVDDVVSTTGVDVRTDASFTVSAWVYLEGNNCDSATPVRCVASAVSLDGEGTQATKFRLGHMFRKGNGYPNGQWVFEMPEPDGTITEAALAVRPAEQLNKWVHLTGVYDAPARTIWLYVNGVERDDGTLLESRQANGALRIGAGGQLGGWRGSVDDVRMYSGALTDDRISALYRSYPAPSGSTELPVADAGYWKFDENTGTTVADSSGGGRNATMKGGAGWYPGRYGTTGWFDGTSGYAETAVPVVTAGQSFSFAAWTFLSNGTRNAAVVGQDGGQASSFLVQYDATAKKWAVIGPQSASGPVNLLSAEPAALGTWTHLVLAFDAGLGQLRLYVNGSLSAVQVGVAIPLTGGPLAIGRCKANGANGCFFPRGIDDVRAYRKALSDGEVRRVHDDAPPASHGYWRFDDGTTKDYSWRQNPTTVSGGASFVQGMHGKALLLDGTSGSATAGSFGVPMNDSFTVAAWAKLTRTDKVATVLGQDGDRRSGFVLQYRPEVNRWLFGAAAHDADLDPMVYANSLQPPTPDAWTHLTGVYDYSARQLRLYVNGELVGSKDNVLLWVTHRGFTIGRAKVNGVPGEFFPGVIDDVTTDLGAVSDAEIKRRAGWPAPAGGQFGRFVNDVGEHYSANATGGMWDEFGRAPAGYHYEGPLGAMLTSERAGTRRLYACLAGADEFTSADPACESPGNTKLADLGWAYVAPPAGSATVALYRCRNGTERFDSTSPTCEARTRDLQDPLGYLSGYSPLVRYVHVRADDHIASSTGTPPGYRSEGTYGLLAMTAEPGTQVLMSCVAGVDGVDQFISTDPSCDGKVVQGAIGRVWTQAPPGQSSRAVYSCAVNSPGSTWNGERFVSSQSNCEGHTPLAQQPIGFVLTAQPAPLPT